MNKRLKLKRIPNLSVVLEEIVFFARQRSSLPRVLSAVAVVHALGRGEIGEAIRKERERERQRGRERERERGGGRERVRERERERVRERESMRER